MSRDFLLGVGGTGAKCVEAFARLAMCGLGPEAAWVGLLDQDRSNGNAGRTARVLSEYVEARAALRTPGGADLGTSALFRTAVDKPKAGWAWAPEERSSTSLSTSIGYPGLPAAEQAIAQALFSAEERQVLLDEGFRQRPALGAAVTLQGVTPDTAVWQDLLGALQAAGHGGEIRVFLAASIFGGTGASGLPTVARLLRTEIKKRRLEGRVRLGGVLMLPYFSFPPPPPGSPAGPQPDSAAFMVQARGALEYYAQLFRSERVFDRLYVVGSDPLIPLRTYSVGGSSQANPPLLPEFTAALAAVDFLRDGLEPDGATYAVGTAATGPVGWDDMAYDGRGGPGALKAAIGDAMRTAVTWRQLYGPALSLERWQSSRREAWFRRLLALDGGTPATANELQGAIRLSTTAFEGLLRWFAALNRAGAAGGRKLTLVADDLLAGPWSSAVVEDLPLAGSVSNGALSRLVPGQHGPSLAEVFSRMTYGPVPTAGHGVGRVLAALHAACAATSQGAA